ncbi:hypothetical protein K2X83_01090 [Patescibacteria group bacterium]|nr:hypothetical protein [Patescibacteria group bacterium]
MANFEEGSSKETGEPFSFNVSSEEQALELALFLRMSMASTAGRLAEAFKNGKYDSARWRQGVVGARADIAEYSKRNH